MYDSGAIIGATSITTATAAVTMLPNTGGSLLPQLAISVLAGLVTWGILYARAKKRLAA